MNNRPRSKRPFQFQKKKQYQKKDPASLNCLGLFAFDAGLMFFIVGNFLIVAVAMILFGLGQQLFARVK